jgi:hypothetical protein
MTKTIPAMFNGTSYDRWWYLEHSKEYTDWELTRMFKRWRQSRKLAVNSRLKPARYNQRIGTKLDA